jgi:hypothetical protein
MEPHEKGDLQSRIPSENGIVQKRPGFLKRCAIKWCIAAMHTMNSLTPTSKSSFELVVNNTINNNFHNVN